MFDPALNTLISHPCLEQHRPDVVAGLDTLTQWQPATSRLDGSKSAEQTDSELFLRMENYPEKQTTKSNTLVSAVYF